MSTDRRAVASALASLALAATIPSAALAQPGKVIPAAKVFPFLEAFLKVPAAERAHLRVTYSLHRDGKPAVGVKAALVENGGVRTPLPLEAATGRFERLPTLAQLQAKVQVAFDVPAATKFGVGMQLDPALAPATAYDARELAVTVKDSNAAIRKTAGPMALMAPTMTGITFAEAGTGVAVFPDGTSRPLPAVKGMPYYRPEQFEGAVSVRLGKMPAGVGFYDKKK
jgi:hypothetical protein